MAFIEKGKTNWKYILVVVVLAAIAGGGTFWLSIKQESLPARPPAIKVPEREIVSGPSLEVVEDFTELIIEELQEGENKLDELTIELLKPYKEEKECIPFNPGLYEEVTGSPYPVPVEEMSSESLSCFEKKETDYYRYHDNDYRLTMNISPSGGTRGSYIIRTLSILDKENDQWGEIFYGEGTGTLIGYKGNLIFLNSFCAKMGIGYCSSYDNILVFDPQTGKSDHYEFKYPANGYMVQLFPNWTGIKSPKSFIEKDGELFLRVGGEYCLLLDYFLARSDAFEIANKFFNIEDIDDPHMLFGACVDAFYLVQDGQFTKSLPAARSFYINDAFAYAEKMEGGLEKRKPLSIFFRNNKALEEESNIEVVDWFSHLMGRTLNYLFAGEEEKAWREFDKDFDRFFPNSFLDLGEENIGKEEIRHKIQEDLQHFN